MADSVKQKTIFDFLNDISHHKVKWEDQPNKKRFQPYMVTRWLSMHPDYLGIVADTQHVTSKLSDREFYIFFTDLLPRRKFFAKYIKAKTSDEVVDRLAMFISNRLQIGNAEAKELLETVDADEVRAWIKSFGYPDSEMKSMFGI